MANELTWHDVLAEEKQQPYFLNTLQTVASDGSPASLSIRHKKMSLTRSALQSWVTLKW